MPFAFAVNRDEKTLYFILNRTATMTKSEDMDSALASYMKSNQEVSFSRFLRDHWIVVLVAVSAVFFVVIMLLSQKLKAERKANEQQRLLDEAAEIVKLKQTISSLLDHMPGMNFSKDAKTGVYLACNQSFADYAHRSTPDDVIGLTAAEIFDAKPPQSSTRRIGSPFPWMNRISSLKTFRMESETSGSFRPPS
jgi:hypothetical protein